MDGCRATIIVSDVRGALDFSTYERVGKCIEIERCPVCKGEFADLLEQLRFQIARLPFTRTTRRVLLKHESDGKTPPRCVDSYRPLI